MYRLACVTSFSSFFHALARRAAVRDIQLAALCLSAFPRQCLKWLLLVFSVFCLAIIAIDLGGSVGLVAVVDC